MDNFITTKELCEYLKVTKTTIERWRKEGLPFSQIGRGIRFKLDEVMQWVEDQK
jgi:excisionase family DNA binding protein